MTMLNRCLAMGSVEKIAENLLESQTSMASGAGVAAQTACIVLAMRDLETTVRKLDRTATLLMVTSLVIAAFGVIIAIIAL
jgi:hypothetical protein